MGNGCDHALLEWSDFGGGRDSHGDCTPVQIFLGCLECSETLGSFSVDDVVRWMNSQTPMTTLHTIRVLREGR